MKKFNEKTLMIIIFAAIIAITLSGLWLYYTGLQKDLEAQTHATLNEILEQQKYNFKSAVEAELETVVASAISVSHISSDQNNLMSAIEEIAQSSRFEFLILADTQGNSINSNGDVVKVTGREHYERAMKGETFVSEPIKSLISDDMIIPFSTPVKKDGEIVGVLIGVCSTERFNNLLLPSFDGKGYAFVVDKDGNIISKTNNEYVVNNTNNLFELWENDTEFYKFDDITKIKYNVNHNKSGHSSYKIGEENRLTHYAPIGVNDWYIFVAVPNEVISENAEAITKTASLLVILIVLCFSMFIFYIIYMKNKAFKINAQHIKGLEKIAYVDDLTGARNYNKFNIDAQKILDATPNVAHIIVKMDIVNFKLINKMYGFETGNLVLKNIAKALDAVLVEDSEIFGRIVVDEFVILQNYYGVEYQKSIQKRFLENFKFLMGKDFTYKVSFKLGQYVVDKNHPNHVDINELFEMANFAHRRAKKSLTAIAVAYDETMAKEAMQHKEIENKMENALIAGEFKVYLQPKYQLSNEKIAGAEALVRWINKDGKLMMPMDFIPLFEKNGFITKLDSYMLNKVCAIIKGWMDNNIEPVTVSVNFSRLHLSNKNFVKNICKTVDSYEIPRKYIEIEITETAIFENLNAFKTVLNNLHQEGFQLSMDDFGSGYSSLGLLQNLHVDVIKIDRSFFLNLENKHRTDVVVANVITMAKELKISTVAEGIEEKSAVDLLKNLGCDMIQGFYYDKPMPVDDFVKKLTEQRKSL
ncbi:MAG: GGDEF domain-containing protein [Clostridiales bacterium]